MRAATIGLGVFIAGFAACQDAGEDLIRESDIVEDALVTSLTASSGNAVRGKAVFVERELGHCVICHVLDRVDVPFQGNVGPSLTGVGDRLSPAQIRLRIADPSKVWPDTVMPRYYRLSGLTQVAPEYAGTPILSGQDIEDLVAFLSEVTVEDGIDDE